MAGNVIAQFEPVNGLGVTVMGGDLVTGGRVAALAERSGLSSAWHRHGLCRSTIAVVDRDAAADDRAHSMEADGICPSWWARRGEGQASTTRS
jgi:hypothetical protein